MSSHNILQLMTHLNDFEITINNVICDFTTRLSALIDANFFLILENRDGRKLCGSPALVDDYARGSLRSQESDQIASYDSKPPNNRFVHLAANGNVDDFLPNDDVVADPVPSAYNALDLSCEIEEANIEEEEEEVEAEEEERRDLKPRRRNKRKPSEMLAEPDEMTQPKKSRMTYDEFGNIEDDICIVEDEGDPEYISDDPIDPSQPREALSADGTSGTPLARTRGRSMENMIAMDPHLSVEAFEVDVSSLNLPANKIQVLQSLEDPAAIFQKDSVEFKLASSILYDFGKELAHACPYAGDGIKAKVFFHQNFKNFLSIFPCLKSDLIQNIRIAKKSAEAHMKNNARAGFNSVFDKRKKDVSYVE